MVVTDANLATTGVNHWVYFANDRMFVGVEVRNAEQSTIPEQLEPCEFELNRYSKHVVGVAKVESAMMNARTITCSINRPPSEVYEFASNPQNLPKWVKSFCLSVKKSGDEWQMETPTGFVGIEFVPANEFGVLDHVVTLPDGESILNPMRVVANGEGCEIMFTLFQREGMFDEQFEKDAGMVEADLRTLKAVLESCDPERNQA